MFRRNTILFFTPFWIFIFLFKISAGLHYSVLSALGERVFPLWLVGALIGGSAFIQLLLDVPAGFLLDRFGYARMLRITTVFFIATAGVLLFGLTPVTFVVTVILAAFAWLFFGPGVDAYVLSQAPSRLAGRFIAWRDILDSGGSAVGMIFLVWVLHFSTPQIGWVILLPLGIAFVVSWFIPRDQASVHAEQKVATHHYYIRRHYIHEVLRAVKTLNPASTLLLLAGLSGSMFYGLIWFVVPIVIARSEAGIFSSFGLGIFDLAVVTLGFLLGRIADRGNKQRTIFFGLFVFALAGSLLGLNFDIWFLVLGFLATTGDEIARISLWAWLNNLDKRHAHDGVVAGAITLFEDLGWTIGPVVAGLLFNRFGPTWTIALGAVPIFTTWVLSYFMLPRPIYSMAVAQEVLAAKPHHRRHKH